MKKSSYFLYGVLAFGAFLIAYIFSLFAGKSGSITPSEWLILAVVYVNYLLLFFDVPLMFGRNRSFSSRIPGIGISAFMQVSYMFLSIGYLITGTCAKLPFEYLVSGQGILFFLLLCGVFFAVLGGEKVAEIVASESDDLECLQSAKRSMDRLVAQVKSKGYCAEIAPIVLCAAETLRYTSSVSSADAKDLERSIRESISALLKLIESTTDDASWNLGAPDARQSAARIANLVDERKSLRN